MDKRVRRGLIVGVLFLLVATPVHAGQDGVERFATFPPGPGHPEGIAADRHGNIYAASFEFPPADNVIHIFRRNGRLKDTIVLPKVSPLGLAFDPDGNLYVADFGNGKVLKFAPPFGSSSTPAASFSVCGGVGAGCALNAITFDASGDLYVSDSLGGNIFKIDLPGGGVSTFFTDPLLRPGTHAFPPFGANGLTFNAEETALFIANTGDDRIFKLVLPAKTLSIFAESINGADGIVFVGDQLWVAANQADEVVALNDKGGIVDRRGSFKGIGEDGAVKGLLFPASLVLSRGQLFVTNAALALTEATGDEPEENVSTFTISKIALDGHDHDRRHGRD